MRPEIKWSKILGTISYWQKCRERKTRLYEASSQRLNDHFEVNQSIPDNRRMAKALKLCDRVTVGKFTTGDRRNQFNFTNVQLKDLVQT